MEEKPATRKLTRREQAVMDLLPKLPELTDAQRRWMKEVPYKEDVAYYWKRGQVWCQNCGHVEKKAALEPSLAINLGMQKYVCPCCGKTLKLEPYSYHWKGLHEDKRQSTIVTTIDGYTVFRTFETHRSNILYSVTVKGVHEVYQNWICPDGREVVIGKRNYSSMWSGVEFDYTSEMTPRKRRHSYYWSDNYDVTNNHFYPHWNVSKILKRNGCTREVFNGSANPVTKLMNLTINPIAEMLVKNGQYRLFDYWTMHGQNDLDKFVPSVRICNRNKYIIREPDIWCDYINLLEYFGKDLRNAFYVCPDNLKEQHDLLMHRKERIAAERRRKEAIRQAMLHEKEYKRMHGKYFGLCFCGGDIRVNVISSVQEMAEEGEYMHHCVYANAYYKKKESLILSARDSDGNRLETIEVSLRSFKIIQSRGKYNNPTDRHDDIIELVTKNMNKIKKIAV